MTLLLPRLYLIRHGETAWSVTVEIRLDQWRKRPLLHRIGGSVARCLSPLL